LKEAEEEEDVLTSAEIWGCTWWSDSCPCQWRWCLPL